MNTGLRIIFLFLVMISAFNLGLFSAPAASKLHSEDIVDANRNSKSAERCEN